MRWKTTARGYEKAQEEVMQCCADYPRAGCLGYVPQRALFKQQDGREICVTCKRNAVEISAVRAQQELFFDQARLF